MMFTIRVPHEHALVVGGGRWGQPCPAWWGGSSSSSNSMGGSSSSSMGSNITPVSQAFPKGAKGRYFLPLPA